MIDYNFFKINSYHSEQLWFQALAELLLNQSLLIINQHPHTLLEIEFYLNNQQHSDPFAHCHPLQKDCARWYFHRKAESYRGGSFKGLDIAFSDSNDFGGILIRSIGDEKGNIINGCSLIVDYILAKTNYNNLASLDAEIKDIFAEDTPLYLKILEKSNNKTIYTSARVGLTLKRLDKHPTMADYILRSYRFLTDITIKKGKEHIIIALYKQGFDIKAIHALTQVNKKSVVSYIAAFQQGRDLENFESFKGNILKVKDICRLHGLWNKIYKK